MQLDVRPGRASSPDRQAIAEGRLGFLHSWTTGSTVDGPGIRVVGWLMGCQFRCQYCHNPDTWYPRNGRRITADALLADALAFEPFMKLSGGGLTLSGGEPLMQAPFVSRVFRACRERGVHTALDTNGFLGHRLDDEALEDVDLVLLDLKAGDDSTHRAVTRQPIEPVLRFARRLQQRRRPVWARFVLVPGLTDAPDNLERIADIVSTMPNVERFEVLPFHQLGRFKWLEQGASYPLRDVPSASPEQVAAAVERFSARGLPLS